MQGIIPACAGSTRVAVHVAAALRDHPRMRGEHSIHQRDRTSAAGSSPHARGAHKARMNAIQNNRIIPACAGSTGEQAGGWA